jgi:hypothetical protein
MRIHRLSRAHIKTTFLFAVDNSKVLINRFFQHIQRGIRGNKNKTIDGGAGG